MCINTDSKEIKMIERVSDTFPKNKSGKNDRVAMVNGIEHGHHYTAVYKFTYADWTEYTTEFTVTKILQNREWINIRDTGEGRLGSFSVLFNSFLAGTFKREAQLSSDNYFRMAEELNKPLYAEIERKDQDIANITYKLNKTENALIVAHQTITQLNVENDKLKNSERTMRPYVKDMTDIELEDRLENFVKMAETLANAKIDHNTFKNAMIKNFHNMFLN